MLIIKTNNNRVLPACWWVVRLSVSASLASAERTVMVICYWCGPPRYITADPSDIDVTEMSSDTKMAPYRFTIGVRFTVHFFFFWFSSAFVFLVQIARSMQRRFIRC